MKKKVLSLLFACIMILSVLAISGCKSDELQAQIDENATKAETAVTDAAAKAETDLAAAKAELEALIAAGDAADAKELADAVAKLNSAIDAAKAAATTADDALKADLTAAIAAAKKEAADGASAALDAAVKKLNDAVALKVDATAYNKAVADLEAAVAAAKKTASDADTALETKLTADIATAKAEAIADAKTYVDAKVAELVAADAKNVADFNKAIADVNAAIDAAEKLAADADVALKAELTTAIEAAKAAAVTEAKAYVDAQVKLLADADKTSADAFNKAIADLETAVATAQAAAEKYAAADAALKAALETAIDEAEAAAVAAAKAYVDEQVAKLETADKTNTDAFNKAIADLETAVATAQATAEKYADADVALKAELKTAIDEAKAAAITEAKAYVDAQIAKFQENVENSYMDKADLAVEIKTLNDKIAAAEAAAKKAATDADAVLADKIAELEAAIAAADKATVDAWGDWNEATDDVIAKLYDLELAYQSFLKGGYHEDLLPKALMIVTETRTKLLRATNVDAVEAEYKYAGEFFKVVVEIYATYEPYAKIADLYYQNEIADLEAAFANAVKAIVDSTDDTENVLAINTTLADDLYKVPNKEKVIKAKLTAKTEDEIRMLVTYEDKWADLFKEVQNMIDVEDDGVKAALDFDAIQNLLNLYTSRYESLLKLKDAAEVLNAEAEYWAKYFEVAASAQNPLLSKTDIEDYATFVEEVENWKFELGATNETNEKLLNSEMIDKAEKNFVTRKEEIQKFAVELLNKLKSFGDGYVYNYSVENQAAVYAVKEEYDLFKAYVEDALKQELTADFVAAYKTFEDGAYARATALAEADIDATAIEEEIVKFTTTLNNLTTFKTEYQKKMTAIDDAVAAWKKAYFAEPFASEAVVGHVNYDILDHAGYEALKALYAEKLGEIAKAMEVVVETFNADGFRKINLLSADEVAAAKDAWAKLITLVGNLGLNTDQIVVDTIIDLGENATTIDVGNELYKKDLQFQAAQAAAYKEYEALNHAVLAADKVSIYDGTAVEKMIEWYDTYLGIKPSDAESVLPVVSIELVQGGVAIDAEVYAAAKATYTAWNALVEAKKDEQDKLQDAIDAFVNDTINTESRAAYDALVARYAAFMSGANVPGDYSADQYKINPLNDTYVIDTTELDAAGAKIAYLEDKRDALLDRIEDLAGMTDALLDVSKKDYNTQLIDKLEADMEAFTVKENEGFNCFAGKEVILTQSREIIEIAVIYARAIKNVGSVEPFAVQDDLTTRATVARNEALKLIRNLAPEAWETSAEYAIEKAKLEVVEKTIAAYVASAKDSALLSSCYFNSVVHHIDEHVTVESLVKFENQGKDVDDLVEEVVDAVSDFIANAEIKN